MNPAYNYIFLDFETTGLDLTQDFPIQIALIKTDAHLRVIDHYSSYISLPETVLQLKANISYITGLDTTIIEKHGQDYTTVNEQIRHFFNEKTIIIGQNISFDLWFLKKFFPQCCYHSSIDTYPLAISTIPYLKTYSLEGIDQHLTKHTAYKTYKAHLLATITQNRILSAHDALYDCAIGICFLYWWQGQYQNFTQHYPYLTTLITECTDKNCIFSLLPNTFTNNSYTPLPTLSSPLKPISSQKQSPSTDRSTAPQHSKYSTKNLTLKQIIPQLPDTCIIALSHASKIDIVKKACPNETFSFFKQEQIIDQNKLKQWLNRGTYSYEELLFVISYLSHHRDWYRVIQAILPQHKYILDYLQSTQTTIPQGKILCSHGGLYHMMEQENRKKDFSDYPICVLDADRRHITYNDFAQKWISLNQTLFLREKTLYQLIQEDDHIQQESFTQLFSYRELFIGYFGIESEKYLEQLQKLEIDHLPTHRAYTKSYGIRKNFVAERTQYSQQYTAPKPLTTLIKKLYKLFEHPILVRRQVSNNKDIDYIIAPSVRYIDFSEYLSFFWDQKLFFFSSSRNEYQQRLPPVISNKPHIITIENTDQLLKTLEPYNKSAFIISHHSEKSKKLFHALHNSPKKKSHKLLAEYLTGGIGKITSLVNPQENNIIIGGYHVLLQLRSQWKTVDTIIIHAIHSTTKPFIQADIAQYAPMRQS